MIEQLHSQYKLKQKVWVKCSPKDTSTASTAVPWQPQTGNACCPSPGGWIKKTMVFSYNEKLKNKNEQPTTIKRRKINLPNNRLCKINQLQRLQGVWPHWYDVQPRKLQRVVKVRGLVRLDRVEEGTEGDRCHSESTRKQLLGWLRVQQVYEEATPEKCEWDGSVVGWTSPSPPVLLPPGKGSNEQDKGQGWESQPTHREAAPQGHPTGELAGQPGPGSPPRWHCLGLPQKGGCDAPRGPAGNSESPWRRGGSPPMAATGGGRLLSC